MMLIKDNEECFVQVSTGVGFATLNSYYKKKYVDTEQVGASEEKSPGGRKGGVTWAKPH